MSKWSTFLKIAQQVGPAVLQFTPLAAIAMPVSLAIGEAQQIEGATGPQKLAHVMAIAISAATAANLEAGRVVLDPATVLDTGTKAIETAVGAIKLVHDAHAPAA